MTFSIFHDIRRGFAFVAAKARHVHIDAARLEAYVRELPDHKIANVLDESHHYSGGAEDTAGYILMLDAINFGSGYKPDMADEGWEMLEDSIYYTVSTRLKQEFERQPITPARAAALAPADITHMLQLPDGKYSREFAGMCAASLNELGRRVATECDDSWVSFIGEAGGSAEKMVDILTELPNFADVSRYDGEAVPFYKRAQIAAADLHLAFGKLGIELFSDMSGLTMFADNGVPHVLFVDGVLTYSADLAARIAAGTPIAAGSPEEIELRACAGHAVELIAAFKNKAGAPLRAVDIDHILWHRSVEQPRYRNSEPHRTRTIFY